MKPDFEIIKHPAGDGIAGYFAVFSNNDSRFAIVAPTTEELLKAAHKLGVEVVQSNVLSVFVGERN